MPLPTEPKPVLNPVDLTQPQGRLNPIPPIQSNNLNPLEVDRLLGSDFVQPLELGEQSSITLDQAQDTLRHIEKATGIKPAIIYAVFVPSTITPTPASNQNQSQESSRVAQTALLRSLAPNPNDRLELILVTAQGNPIHCSVNATRANVIPLAKQFRQAVIDVIRSHRYLAPAKQMYQWLVTPLQDDLQQLGVNNLVYIMDAGLRSIPLAALHDGKEFIKVHLRVIPN